MFVTATQWSRETLWSRARGEWGEKRVDGAAQPVLGGCLIKPICTAARRAEDPSP